MKVARPVQQNNVINRGLPTRKPIRRPVIQPKKIIHRPIPDSIDEIWEISEDHIDALSINDKWIILEQMLEHHNWTYKFSSRRAYEIGEKQNSQICRIYGRLVSVDMDRVQTLYYTYSIFHESDGSISKRI